MLEIKQTMKEFLDDLVDIGLISSVKEGLNLDNLKYNGNAHKLNLLAATYCAGLYPQVAKILRPPKRFIEVMVSAVEKDVEAKEMKFYIPKSTEDGVVIEDKPKDRNTTSEYDIATTDLQRVFIHPSSANFNNTSFKAANYILFGEKQVISSFNNETKANDTKIYLRDTSEVTAYALLFFGGKIDYRMEDGLISVDQWITFACSERIAILIQKIRQEFENVLQEKIEDPAKDISTHHLISIVSELLESSAVENR